jgi:hypothetical protein
MMKTAFAALTAMALVSVGLSTPAAAQGLPKGSYQQSCTNINMNAGTLAATCKTERGGTQRSELVVGSCRGDIGNNNGILGCAGGQGRVVGAGPGGSAPGASGPGGSGPGPGGMQPTGQMPSQPGYGTPPGR